MPTKNIPSMCVAIADSQHSMRAAFTQLITSFGGLSVVFETASGTEMLSWLGKAHPLPNLCITEIPLPGMSGYELAYEVKRRFPTLKVLALTGIEHEQAIAHMLKCGADGYVLKRDHPDDVRQGIISTVMDSSYYSLLITHSIHRILHGIAPQLELNDRYIQMLKLCGQHKSYGEIASLMNISERTVHGYRDTLFHKLEMHSKTELAEFARDMGLLDKR